jgi:hypothetical protein
VAGHQLKYVLEAVAANIGLEYGSLTVQFKDGYYTSAEVEHIAFVAGHPVLGDSLDTQIAWEGFEPPAEKQADG